MDPSKGRHVPGRFSAWWLHVCQILVLLALCDAPALRAAPASWDSFSDIVFHHVGAAQGLPNQVVSALAEDKAGFIWMGTQSGLARWDGYRFKVFQPDPERVGSLPGNNILSLFNDQSGTLWVGSAVGLARYEAATERFHPISLHPKRSAVYAMADDGARGIWVGGAGGLQHIRADGSLLALEPGWAAVAQEDIRALVAEPGGRLWVGGRNGLWYRNGKNEALRPFPFSGEQRPFVLSLQRSKDGRIWMGTNGNGAYLLNPGSMTVQALRGQDNDTVGLDTSVITAIGDPGTGVGTGVGTGEMWLSCVGCGVLVVDQSSLRIRRLNHELNLPHSLADNSSAAFLRDRAGLIWVATYRGVSRFHPGQNAILTIFGNPLRSDRLADTDISALKAMPDGSLWFGLRTRGLNIVNTRHQVKWLAVDSSHPETALPFGPVRAISAPIQGKVYFATNRGLYRSDTQGEHVQRVAFRQPDSVGAVVSFAQQGDHLWLGGVDGLWLLDLSQGEYVKARRIPGSEFLNKQLVMALELGRDGFLWIATRENGLVRLKPETGRFDVIRADPGKQDLLSSDSIATLFEDRQGRLWVGTQGGGLSILLNPGVAQGFRFQRIGLKQGLPNLMVNKILADDKERIWLSTDGGLALIDPNALTVRALGLADGVVIAEHWSNAGTKTARGEILFGGAGGVTLVVPDRFKPLGGRAPLVLSYLEVGGKQLSADRFNHGPGGSATTNATANAAMKAGMSAVLNVAATNKVDPVIIRPQANSLKVEFSALDYMLPEYNQYAYRLDGYDPDWIRVDFSRRLISYVNLVPGNYTLRLRGSNHLGVWNDEELRIPIRALPAWYQSWWWYFLIVAAFVALVWALVQWRTRYWRKRQLQLEQVVAQRTSQLLQQAKIASLGTLTAGIAHEINNPSNFAHVGAYNLGTQLQEFQQLLSNLAGEDAPRELHDTLQQQFDRLNASLAAISEGTSRIRDLVKDLRTFSRLDEAQWKSVAIADSLVATVNLVRTQYMNQVEIRCDLAANPVIECSPAQLNQVFMNLIVNACQAICSRPQEVCAANPGLLLIRSKIVGKWLKFEFEDNGGGIPDAIRERIFDPFFTTKTVGEGMGMGLSISLGIIQKQRGTIEVHSVPGQGCCFVVSLLLLE